jgi:SAM-dependent methyltransferase
VVRKLTLFLLVLWPLGAGAAPASTSTAVAGGVYLGRKIAPTMSYHGAGWLVRPERAEEEDTDLLLEALGLEPGDVACDLGAGNGYHSLRMAKVVGPEGQVLASDLQTEMLEMLENRAIEAGADNVKTLRAAPEDPRFPEDTCDLVLMVDVYHELSNPPAVLDEIRSALAPGGRVAVVEYRAEDPEVPIKPRHKMTKAQVERELETNRFRLASSFDELPWQHLLFFVPEGE